MKEQINIAKEKMNKSINALSNEFASIRAGRANPAVLDKVLVDYYGSPTPVNTDGCRFGFRGKSRSLFSLGTRLLSSLSRRLSLLPISVSTLQMTETLSALLSLSLQRTDVRNSAKDIKKYGEECKVTIRNARRDAMDKLKAKKKNAEITEDDLKECEKKVQKLTDDFCADVDKLVADKEKEIMTV